MPSFLKRLFSNAVAPLVKAEIAELAKAAGKPQVTEVPTAFTVGAQYTGAGARRKYMGTIDFDSLRTFSVVYDVARVCINHRKRQMANLEWAIVPVDDKAEPEQYRKQIDELTLFFEEPCNGHDFKTWLDKFLEDILVLDAGVMWKDRTFGRKMKELLPVDGATIRIKMSTDGTLPEAPEAAFQQVIYGEVKGEYTTDEMYYKMMNPRNNTPYGLGPLEALVIGVESALRSQLNNAAILSEGTVPEGFLALPSEWTVEQIKDYEMWFNSLIAGSATGQNRIKMIPGGKGVGYLPTKKAEDMRMLEFEKWLLMKCCAMFDVPPEAIGFVDNVTRSTTETQQQFGNERGLVPMANFLKKFFTQVIHKDFGYTMLKFEWKGLQVVDTDFELERDKSMVMTGAKTINEWRIEQGMDPLKDEAADKPMIFGMGGAVLLEDVGAEEEETEETPGTPVAQTQEEETELEEMQKWEAKCINHVRRGRGIPPFVAKKIDKAVQSLIKARLSVAKSKEEVRAAFKPFKDDLVERGLIKEVIGVKERVSNFKRNRYDKVGSGS